MSNSVLSIFTVVRKHRLYKSRYVEPYGNRLGVFLYSQARRAAAELLRGLSKELRRNMYFRFDSVVQTPEEWKVG